MTQAIPDLRWRDYVLHRGDEFESLWKSLLSDSRNLLFIFGHGFDERMCIGLEAILRLGGEGKRDVCLLEYHEGPSSRSQEYGGLRVQNGERLTKAMNGRGNIERREVVMFSNEGRRIGSRSITTLFKGVDEFSTYSDLVVDISALPRGLYLPLLSKLLALLDSPNLNGSRRPNLHVVVAHAPRTDRRIQDQGIDETASFLHGFSAASFEREATQSQPRVWIPLLGPGHSAQLERIFELVDPDEICPLLPSPSLNPREADELFLEYRELLQDRLRVEPQNFIYASESNPFEVYRQLMRSVLHYKDALAPLGGCKAVFSVMSSKLVSVGALLAAYELSHGRPIGERVDVGVAHVDAQGYEIGTIDESSSEPELFNLWLSGDCYVEFQPPTASCEKEG